MSDKTYVVSSWIKKCIHRIQCTVYKLHECRGGREVTAGAAGWERSWITLSYLSLGRRGQLYLAELHSLLQRYVLINLEREHGEQERYGRATYLHMPVVYYKTQPSLFSRSHLLLQQNVLSQHWCSTCAAANWRQVSKATVPMNIPRYTTAAPTTDSSDTVWERGGFPPSLSLWS